ncbi:hypothetical protein EV385_1930 [Krasilnikovia cinnamomea]|uniref:Uncharacterized protein n=1 Tax=Krasilnikovia cinnamomea TaxID=349313 RepID=A0A4Q7ZIW0_9ACTN|nr:hypothetical protein [Krasilnikovia cinnamomea]RZU50165.1 hypothetical protein EV385_1930 [Krasilnikovia cinnamomea]
MTAPGNNAILIVLALAFVIASGYASGRIHQWYKNGLERDQAYREGYDHASHSLFDMAMQNRATRERSAEAVSKASGKAVVKLMETGRTRTVGSGRRRIPSAGPNRPVDQRGRHSAA